MHNTLFNLFIKLIKQRLEDKNFNISNIDDNNLLIYILNYLERVSLLEGKRNIHYSSNFYCPEIYLPAVKNIEKVIESGASLKPYMSKTINDFSYIDPMFNDWNICHFHLGDSLNENGFIKRTGKLLYAIFDKKNAYFINVFSHADWSNINIIQAIYDNWPLIIEPHIVKNMKITHPITKSEDIKAFRDMNISYVVELNNGVQCMPPSLGVTGLGTKVEHTFTYNKIRNYFDILENDIRVKFNIDDLNCEIKDIDEKFYIIINSIEHQYAIDPCFYNIYSSIKID